MPVPSPAGAGRVVIAGGSGFIGSRLARHLHDAGFTVTILSRSQQAERAGIRFRRWHPPEPGDWQQELAGATAVINLCGASLTRRWTPARKRELVESRTVPSRALVTACAAADPPPAALLQASGVNYYGTGPDERAEEDPPGQDFLAHLAMDWEAPLAETDLRTVSLRFGVVLDRNAGALPQMLLPFRLFVGGPIAGGRQWLSWIHVDDAVRAIHFLMDSPLVDAVNVTAPEPVRNAEFAAAAGRALNRPALLPTPGLLLRAVLGEQATLVCDGVHALPAKLQRAGFEFRYPTLQAALADLLVQPG